MAATQASGSPPGSSHEPAAPAVVPSLDARRIDKALAARSRYKYVHPRVLREGAGWKVVSPNCSRNIDPSGGDIDIAWLVPVGAGLWRVHTRDHARSRWDLSGTEASLPKLLELLCADARREFWV